MSSSEFDVVIKLLVFIAAVLVVIAIELGVMLAWLHQPTSKNSAGTTRADNQH
jgi:hypothetical protein